MVRATSQALLNAATDLGRDLPSYRLFPVNDLVGGGVARGYDAFADALATHPVVTIDGFSGVRWEVMRAGLDAALRQRDVTARWVDVADALGDVEALAATVLFPGDPLFGRLYEGGLDAFFDTARLRTLQPAGGSMNIIYGCGAALAGWPGFLVHADVPKNEIQYRARAGSVANLGLASALSAKEAYRRCYYLDWPALTRHRAAIAQRVGLFVDAQDDAAPSLAEGAAVRDSLMRLGRSVIRPRPWFESGAWGGQWLKRHVAGVAQDVVNYAWSFEMITPENGVLLGDGADVLEVSFDLLMALAAPDILGDYANRYGTFFPVRINLLDTIEGGNLSVQCHPSTNTIAREFGEPVAQDETYYILEREPGARVYLGLREGADVAAFRALLQAGGEVDIDAYVGSFAAEPGDLFLIPHGAVHSAGRGCLVLEISSTPYLYTFKMYDWMRADLDGHPRPLNIERAFGSLNPQFAGAYARDHLRARANMIAAGDGWRRVHLPTHAAHAHDVTRLELRGTAEVATGGSFLACNVAKGGPVRVEAGGVMQICNRLETFCIAAAAESARLTNLGAGEAHVMLAAMKPEAAR